MKEPGKRTQRTFVSSPRILELKKRKRKILKVKIIFFSVLTLILLVGLCFLSRWKEINISNIQIIGNKIVDTAVIDKVVQEELNGYYLWVIPKRNSLVVPRSKIKKRLEAEFKRFENVDLEVRDTKVLEIFVTEHKALYTWCGEDLKFYNEILSLDDEEEKNCYFMNEAGYVFDKAPYFSGNVYFKFFGALDKKTENPLGQSYFPENFSKMVSLLDSVKSFDLKPASLFIKDDTDIILYLKSNTFSPDSHKIIFNTNSDIPKILENLHASITTEPLKSELEKKYEDLLYIDLRFGNKIYYKFR